MKHAVSHKNGQIFHRILRKRPETTARPVSKMKLGTTENQHHADKQIEVWSKIWKVDVDKELVLLGTSQSSPNYSQANTFIPPIISRSELDRFKRIIKSFSSGTAVAHDKLPPRIMEHLDDETLEELIVFYKRVEAEGTWPQAWRIATMVMIPKAEAFKWRLIAMLVTPYRIWARAAGEDVSVWMSSLNRDWIANGPKKSAEDAVYQLSIKTEGDASEYGRVDVAVIDDLEKGFEKVSHDELRSKARVYRFPEVIMNVALSMYTGARRIRCGKAFSKAAHTQVGVLAGCPIAMGLLLLANLDPVDRFWKALPAHIQFSIVGLKVYVDDFMMVFSFDTNKVTGDQIVTRVRGAYTRLSRQIKRAGGNFAVGKGKVAATGHQLALSIAKSLNCCTCGTQDCFSDRCKCDTNHKIMPTKNMVMLGVDYAAGRPVTYEKSAERIANASDKAAKILSLGKGGRFSLIS